MTLGNKQSAVDGTETGRASFFILQRRGTQTVIIAAPLSPLISLCCCHLMKFNNLSVPAAARAWARVLATMASTRGGSNGQLHAIRFQPICWPTRVMWKHFDCARPMRCFRHTYSENLRLPRVRRYTTSIMRSVVLLRGEEHGSVYSQPGHHGSPDEAESRR